MARCAPGRAGPAPTHNVQMPHHTHGPVQISQRSTPILYRSTFSEHRPPVMTSGAIPAGAAREGGRLGARGRSAQTSVMDLHAKHAAAAAIRSHTAVKPGACRWRMPLQKLLLLLPPLQKLLTLLPRPAPLTCKGADHGRVGQVGARLQARHAHICMVGMMCVGMERVGQEIRICSEQHSGKPLHCHHAKLLLLPAAAGL